MYIKLIILTRGAAIRNLLQILVDQCASCGNEIVFCLLGGTTLYMLDVAYEIYFIIGYAIVICLCVLV